MGGTCSTYRRDEMRTVFWLESLKERDHSEGLRIDWEDNIRMDLREIRWGRCGLDSSGSGYGPVAGSCEHSNELTGSIKDGKFRD
jgi:hypothetical protein